jgi:hypothetical protein
VAPKKQGFFLFQFHKFYVVPVSGELLIRARKSVNSPHARLALADNSPISFVALRQSFRWPAEDRESQIEGLVNGPESAAEVSSKN